MANRNIDAVLGAVGQGHKEAEERQPRKAEAPKASKRKTIVATFTYTTDFLDQVRRLGLDWRARAIPASGAREGSVIQALAEAALADSGCLDAAFSNAKKRGRT
jgi:hypothetical protein